MWPFSRRRHRHSDPDVEPEWGRKPARPPDTVLLFPAAPGMSLTVEPMAQEHSLGDGDVELRLWWHSDPDREVNCETDIPGGYVVVETIEAMYYEVLRGEAVLETGGFPP